MTTKKHGVDLRAYRTAAGLSQRALARLIGERQSNIQYWESTGRIPRSDILAPMAKALGISVDALLGSKPDRKIRPGGKLGEVFDSVSQLPRRQQQKVIEFVEAFVDKKTVSS